MAGENMTLTYASDAVHSIKVKANAYAWNFTVVAPESHAREHRAMYPHQRGLGQFMIQGQFLNYREYRTFMDFLRGFAKAWLHPPAGMAAYMFGVNVILSSDDYNEMRVGIPVRGLTDGDHVGQIGYTSPVVFQTISDPLDPTMFVGADIKNVSYWEYGDNYTEDSGGTEDDTTKFFYPFSKGSTNADTKATDLYDLGAGDKGPAPVQDLRPINRNPARPGIGANGLPDPSTGVPAMPSLPRATDPRIAGS